MSKQTLAPKNSRETAFRLWLNGKMPDSYFMPNYLTPEEAREYYRKKAIDQKQEQEQRKAMEKEIDKQIEEKIVPAIQTALNGF